MIRLAALALALAALAAGCYESSSSAPAPPPPPAVTEEAPPATTEAAPPAGGSATAGEVVFATGGCGSCHTLAAAGATGTLGPNLDETQPSFDLVVERVTNGKPPMPSFAGAFTEQQILDVAAFVSESAGT